MTGATRRLYRSRTNRVFAGVCGGLAEYYGADASAVRLVAVAGAVFTVFLPALVIYALAAVLIPEEGDGEARAAAHQGASSPRTGSLVLGILLVGIGALALANQLLRIDWGVLWPVGLIVAGAILVFAVQRR